MAANSDTTAMVRASQSASLPWNVCHEADAPASASDRMLYSSQPPAWTRGVEAASRVVAPGADSAVLSLVVGVLVLIGLNMRHVKRLFKSLPQDLLSVRRRANAFDEHTASESRVAMLLLLQLCVCEGLMMFMWLGAGEAAGQTVVTVAALAGLAGAFYLFQLGACVTVGYVFTDSVGAGLWRQGLNASQMLLGVVLTVPTLVALFYPGVSGVMLAIAAGLYLLSRICYISKGFRIFYNNFPSLLYFILYLCTLEIIPVITILILAREICVNLK